MLLPLTTCFSVLCWCTSQGAWSLIQLSPAVSCRVALGQCTAPDVLVKTVCWHIPAAPPPGMALAQHACMHCCKLFPCHTDSQQRMGAPPSPLCSMALSRKPAGRRHQSRAGEPRLLRPAIMLFTASLRESRRSMYCKLQVVDVAPVP